MALNQRPLLEQRQYRQALNPYLSPAAVGRWVPVVRELVRACLDEKIETGQIDFVDDLANVVPAVLTLALMGIPLKHWTIYCEPTHAAVYTRPDSPDMARWRKKLFLGIARNAGNPVEYFALPEEQTVIFGSLIPL